MEWLKNIYRKNIYGVMGTLIFHILLISAFLLADIDIKGKMKEEPIIIQFTDIIPEVKEVVQHEQPEKNNPGTENKLTTNKASNITAIKEDKFFDEDYRKEISDAKKLVSKVNDQLKKEVISIDNIKMPVENTTGMEPASIKNIIYSGESNITYDLKNRYHVSLPIPVYLAQGGGVVIVDIIVGRNGKVIKATTRSNSKIIDSQVFYYAQLAASRTIFNPDKSAPELQNGTIKYNFIAQ